MKLEIQTTAKVIKDTNRILSRAIKQLTLQPQIREDLGMSKNDLERVENFRSNLIKKL